MFFAEGNTVMLCGVVVYLWIYFRESIFTEPEPLITVSLFAIAFIVGFWAIRLLFILPMYLVFFMLARPSSAKSLTTMYLTFISIGIFIPVAYHSARILSNSIVDTQNKMNLIFGLFCLASVLLSKVIVAKYFRDLVKARGDK